jgi:AAA domain
MPGAGAVHHIKFDQTQDPEDEPYLINGLAFGLAKEIARGPGKTSDLAFLYSGSISAWRNLAPDDTSSDEVILSRRDAWRAKHPMTVRFWSLLDTAAIRAVHKPGAIIPCGRLAFKVEGDFLKMKLPSGRKVAYPFPKLITNRRGYPAVSYMDNEKGKWVECRGGNGSYHAIWMENAVGAIARDLFASAMPRLEQAGYPIVVHVHDEICAEVPIGFGSNEDYQRLLIELPEWAAGLPLSAKVRRGPRFCKLGPPKAAVPARAEPVAANSERSDPQPAEDVCICVQCHDAIAAGEARADAHNGSFLHPRCVEAFLHTRMTEEAIPWQISDQPASPPPPPPIPPSPPKSPPSQANGPWSGNGASGSQGAAASPHVGSHRTNGSQGSQAQAARDTYAQDHAGEPFSDFALRRQGYELRRAFDYTLPDGTSLYQQLRYELRPNNPPTKSRPRKRFLPRRQINGGWVFGAGDRRVPYRWPGIMRAGPGATVFVPEGEGKADDLAERGFLATTVISHKWTPECIAALTGQHVIILADHDDPMLPDRDKSGKNLAEAARRYLAPVAASIRVVPYMHLWERLPEESRKIPPGPTEDISDWLKDRKGDPARLLEICREIPAAGEELDEWDAGDILTGERPKPRQWLTARCFCKRFLSGLVAPGDAGKTTLRLTQAIELAIGRELLGLRIHRRCRVLIVSFEDDRDELHRRLAAICKHHNIDPAELKGWLFCRELNGVKLAEIEKGKRKIGPLDAMLRRAIARTRCDLLILDPFVKIHALDENDNPAMDFVCERLVKLAHDCNIAVDSPAHTHKGAIAAGDADARRGASAQRDAGRLDYTLTTMSEDEAKRFDIPIDERKSYVRLDKAKANLVRAVKASWFRLVSVNLGNATPDYPDGDEMQAIERWEPPETWAGVEPETVDAILDEIAAGLPDGRRYSDHGAAKDRAAWTVVREHCPEKSEAQCREMIRQWVKAKVLFTDKYTSPERREAEKGLFVDSGKRPRHTKGA